MAKLAVLGDSDSLERPMVSLSPIAMHGKLIWAFHGYINPEWADVRDFGENAKRFYNL